MRVPFLGRLRRMRQAQLRKRRTRRAVQQFSAFQKPYRLHLGCGKVHLDGCINVDVEGDPSKVDVYWNLTEPFPLPDGCCSRIYHEHVLEHLPVDQGVALLAECRRLLMPGGVMRVAMPDLQETVRQYQSEDWKNQDWLRWPEHQFIQTRAEMINISFRWWGHQWLYDHEELQRRLRESGFESAVPLLHGESGWKDLQGLETRVESMLIFEAIG